MPLSNMLKSTALRIRAPTMNAKPQALPSPTGLEDSTGELIGNDFHRVATTVKDILTKVSVITSERTHRHTAADLASQPVNDMAWPLRYDVIEPG
jgi:hypothetical protein